MNLSNRITAKQNRLVAINDSIGEIRSLLESDGERELSDEDQDRLDTLTGEHQSVQKSLDSLLAMERSVMARATPVSFSQRGIAPGAPAKKPKGGSLLAKHATAALFAHQFKAPVNAVVDELYGNEDEVKATLGMVHKTATPAADTTTSGWAQELLSEDVDAFLEELQPISVFAALRAQGRGLNFRGLSSLKIPSRAATTGATNDMAGDFVGELGVIPVKRAAITAATLNAYKMAVITAWSQELDVKALPQIEGLVREFILDDTAKALDSRLLDAKAAVANVRPAGLLHSVTLTPSVGATAGNIVADLKVLFTAMQNARVGAKPVLIMNSIRTLGLSTVTTPAGGFMFRDELAAGRLLGVPLIAAEHVKADEIYIVDAGSFVGANDTPVFNVSDQAVLTMANADDTAPTQAEDGTTAGDIGTAGEVPPKRGIHVGEDASQAFAAGYGTLNLYQQYALALRMVLPTSWAMVRTGGVAGISGVAW